MSDVARILDVLRDAATRGDDLSLALRDCGLPGSTEAAARLTAGATLPKAVAGLVPARIATLLAGGLPPLATVTTLLADEAWRQAERQRMVIDHLAYPLTSVALIAVMAVVVAIVVPHNLWYAPLASAAWAVPPALCAAIMLYAPWAPRTWRLPGSGWAAHLDQASRWSRAALAVHWRLTEAQTLHLLGTDLSDLTAVLGAPDAKTHCTLLAAWHRRTATRRLAFTAVVCAALILAAGGGVVLGAARLWTAAAT